LRSSFMDNLHTIDSVILKELVTKILGIFGLEVRKKSGVLERSFIAALEHASSLGLFPATVIDVGAAYGTFTLECHNIFPKSRYLLIEPLQEYERYLQKVVETVPYLLIEPLQEYERYLQKVVETVPKAEYVLSAAAAKGGEVGDQCSPGSCWFFDLP